MRAAMTDYVRSLHLAYLDVCATLPPADRARMPALQQESFTVLAVGTRYLHVIGTTDLLPEPTGPEIAVADELIDHGMTMSWTLRFFDPVVSPGLGLIDESQQPRPDRVRDVLGVRTVSYHLTVPPGSGLSGHHAQHAGTGLAHTHAAAGRDFATLAALRPSAVSLITEMHAAHVNDLPWAHLLIARSLAGEQAITAAAEDFDTVRRQTLDALRMVSP